MSGEPIRNLEGLHRQSADPFQIDQARNIPVSVNIDVELVYVGKLERKWSVTVITVDEPMRQQTN